MCFDSRRDFSLKTFPLLGKIYSTGDFNKIDLSSASFQMPFGYNYKSLSDYVESHRNGVEKVLYGGYLEKRNLYQSALFETDDAPMRNIHLGIDLWVDFGTKIYAPLGGTIHSFKYNHGDLNYGYTLIVHHVSENDEFYCLYGHLDGSMMNIWKKGKSIKGGDHIATVGSRDVNGGWVPHLHFQVILDIGHWIGDYPGVCSIESLEKFKRNCPDPIGFLNLGLNNE